MTWPGITLDIEYKLFMLHLSSIFNFKEVGQEIWIDPIQNIRI
jgi:hypothetical protein